MAKKTATPANGSAKKRGANKKTEKHAGAPIDQSGPSEATERAMLESIVAKRRNWKNVEAIAAPYIKDVKTAQGEYRNQIKLAKNAGLDEDAISCAIDLADKDPNRAVEILRAEIRYLKHMELPLGTQSSLFEDAGPLPSIYDQTIAKFINLGRQGVGSLKDHLDKIDDDNLRIAAEYGWSCGQAILGGAAFPVPTRKQETVVGTDAQVH